MGIYSIHNWNSSLAKSRSVGSRWSFWICSGRSARGTAGRLGRPRGRRAGLPEKALTPNSTIWILNYRCVNFEGFRVPLWCPQLRCWKVWLKANPISKGGHDIPHKVPSQFQAASNISWSVHGLKCPPSKIPENPRKLQGTSQISR